MATFVKLPSGSWRAIVRRKGRYISETFHQREDARRWATAAEAKWTADPLPASAIYAFKGKVDGKLTGTIGVMIAVNGFSEDAHDALLFGKELNVLLMDGVDLEIALEFGMERAMRAKVRAAAEIGTAFHNLRPVKSAVRTPRREKPGTISGSSGPRLLEFVVEGRTDAVIVQTLAKRLLEGHGDYDLMVQIAGGKLNIPTIANGSGFDSSRSDTGRSSHQVIVVDGDGEPDQTRADIEKLLERPSRVVVIEPSIEQWFAEADREMSVELMKRVARKGPSALIDISTTLDLDLLRERSASFRSFEDALLNPPKPPKPPRASTTRPIRPRAAERSTP